MADVTATYDGNEIGSLSNSGTMTLETAGTYCDDDIEIVYVKSGGGGGTDISDSTVTPADVLSGVSVYVWNSQTQTASKESGTIPLKAAATYNTSISDQTIAAGQYLNGAQTIKAVETSGITAANIKYGAQVKVGDANDDDRIANVTGSFTASNTVSSGQSAAGAGQIVSGYSAWVDGAEVRGSIASKTSSDLTVSGATVTAPAGVYASAASKSVATGSVTAPSSVSGSDADKSIANGIITLTKDVYITPVVTSDGYVTQSQSVMGQASVSLSTTILTKGATTYTPGTTNQTIAANNYLTGDQTILGDADLVAGNIKKDVTIFGVTGSYEGGGGDVFAFIVATFPTSTSSGTTSCWAVNAAHGSSYSKRIDVPAATLAAGQYVFDIPTPNSTPETWTVYCTDGESTPYVEVSIFEEGQRSAVELTYWDGGLYNEGDEYTEITGGWNYTNVVRPTAASGRNTYYAPTNTDVFSKNASSMTINAAYPASANNSYSIITGNAIDITGWSTLKATITATGSPTADNMMFGLSTVAGDGTTGTNDNRVNVNSPAYASSPTSASTVTLSVDLTNVADDNYYIIFVMWRNGVSNAYFSVSKVWFE